MDGEVAVVRTIAASIPSRPVVLPRDVLLIWDDPDYVVDVLKDPVGFKMFWIYYDQMSRPHSGRCVNFRHGEQNASIYGYGAGSQFAFDFARWRRTVKAGEYEETPAGV